MAKRKRASRSKLQRSWSELLAAVSTPLLLVDTDRRIAFANQPLADWAGLPLAEIVGGKVEYHSEPPDEDSQERGSSVLTGLCPPPAAFSGIRVQGTLSSLSRDGRLCHRRGEFLPLQESEGFAVLAVLDSHDLTPEELASSLTAPADSDGLHRQLRQLRRDAAKRYSVASLVGASAAMRLIRAQVSAAARSRANVLISGRPGSGRSHIANAIHYAASSGATTPLVTLNCNLLTEDQLRRGLDALRRGAGESLPTLLLVELGALNDTFQQQLAQLLRLRERECQMIATIDGDNTTMVDLSDELRGLLNTITIATPPLATRREDLPLLAQFFVEEANVDSSRQVGGVSTEVVERLALYQWPGEIQELRDAIRDAHVRCDGHEIQAADLPVFLHHAAQAAQFSELPPEKIALDEFMIDIERELVLRALEQSEGNKALAARLLGMTRPRLYRRLEQLGLLSEDVETATQEPEDDGK